MREIKFRAWDEDNCELVYFNNRKLTQDEYQRAHLAMLLAGDYGDVLTQYIGLKDNNGVEIYEGDIVVYMHCTGNQVGVIKFVAPEFSLIGNDGYNIGTAPSRGFEVIGNIYENPELLEANR